MKNIFREGLALTMAVTTSLAACAGSGEKHDWGPEYSRAVEIAAEGGKPIAIDERAECVLYLQLAGKLAVNGGMSDDGKARFDVKYRETGQEPPFSMIECVEKDSGTVITAVAKTDATHHYNLD